MEADNGKNRRWDAVEPEQRGGSNQGWLKGYSFHCGWSEGVGVAGIVRGSEGLMRILKRLEEDFPQLRYHRQAGLNVCVCVWHAVCYRNCLFSCLFSHIFPLASSVWWVMWNDLQTVQVAVSIKLNCKKNIACPVVFLWKLRRRTNNYIKTGTCCPQTQPCA